MVKNPVLFNKTLVIGIIILFIGMSISPSANINLENKSINPLSNSNTLYVGGTGLGNYTSIQDAINDTNHGDTVFVLDDSSPYYENVVVNKSINLYGENKDTTIIDGMKKSYVIDVQADDVHIRGFTIKNATKNLPNAPSGIYCSSLEGSSYNNLHIEYNIIAENPNGINLLRSHNSNISNNIIKSNGACGLHIWLSDNFSCYENEITENGNWAVFFLNVQNSTVSNNLIYNNDGALKFTWRTNNTLISDNIIYGNDDFIEGLWLSLTSSHNIISNNYFNNNVMWEINMGIETCLNNNFYHNELYGICYDDEGIGMWDDGYPSGGNYWSDYTGEDNYQGPNQDIPGSDGIGDTPHYFFVNSKDRYPLMEPYIENWVPFARFTYLENKYIVDFDASSSFDFQGSIVSYEWDFGDGKTGEGKTVSHDYNGPGKYDVTLTVTDNDGTSDTYSWEVLLFPIPEPDLIPDLSCQGNLVWKDVKPGETIDGGFIVENIGVSGSFLDWEIIEYPEWGEWSFDPENGTDLPGGDSNSVSVEVIAPDEPNEEFTDEVKVVNMENSSDYEIIIVSLTIPRNKPVYFNLLEWFLEQFPFLGVFLRAMNLLR